jgi:transcriptional regulator with XRE-family HTH domain
LVITTEHSRQNVAEPTKCDIKVKATTYNTYESGRTEPPIEILERLSYLYKVSIDIIVQKQRLFRDAKDLKAQLEETRKELAEIEKQLVEQGADSPAMQEHKRVMETLIKQLEILIQNEETQKELEV